MAETESYYRQGGYAAAVAAGAHGHRQIGPTKRSEKHDQARARRLLCAALNAKVKGKAIAYDDLAELRGLAVRMGRRDRSGVAAATMATLWLAFDDRAARAWLPSMLASAGDLIDAAALDTQRVPEGPPASADVIVAAALAAIGHESGARSLMERLENGAPGVRRKFISVWGQDGESRIYAQLVARSPASARVLPVFFHLPFSGGTSMIVSLKKVVPWGCMLEIRRRYGLLQIEQALQMTSAEVARLMMVRQHHPFALTLPGRELSYFTVLRDPVSQIASGFFKRGPGKGIVPTRDTNRSRTLEEHIDYTLANGLTNMLARQIVTTHPALQETYQSEFDSPGAFRAITAEEDMYWFQATSHLSDEQLLTMSRETLDERFHLVGSMRHLAASHLAATASVGVPIARRIEHRGKSGRPDSSLEDAATSRLREANWVDQQLFDEYTSRFERDYEDLVYTVEGAVQAA